MSRVLCQRCARGGIVKMRLEGCAGARGDITSLRSYGEGTFTVCGAHIPTLQGLYVYDELGCISVEFRQIAF